MNSASAETGTQARTETTARITHEWVKYSDVEVNYLHRRAPVLSNVNVPFIMDRQSEVHLAKGTVIFCCIIHNDCNISLRGSSAVYTHALLYYPTNYLIPWRKTFLEHFILKSSTLLECCAVSIGKCLPLVDPIFEFEVTGNLNFHQRHFLEQNISQWANF